MAGSQITSSTFPVYEPGAPATVYPPDIEMLIPEPSLTHDEPVSCEAFSDQLEKSARVPFTRPVVRNAPDTNRFPTARNSTNTDSPIPIGTDPS